MYAQYSISSVAEVPPLLKAFAASLGWTTSGVCSLTRPGGGLQFDVSAGTTLGGGGGNFTPVPPLGVHHWLQVKCPSKTQFEMRSYLPRLNGDVSNGWQTSLPSKLHLIGGSEESTPYVHAVIECGYNDYRHVYVGNLVKVGDYTGGEVISSTNYQLERRDANSFPRLMRDDGWRGLFTASSASYNYPNEVDENSVQNRENRQGGANIVHSDNPNPVRRFNFTGGPPLATEIFGGYSDGPNEYMVDKAFAAFAGASILVPINLWCSHLAQVNRNDARFIPVGNPAGVRMVNMRDLAPGAEIEVGNKHFRVFPDMSKQDVFVIQRGTAYAANESTGYLGYAFLVD